MSIDLSRVTGISDSRGVITEIKDSLGRVIWSASRVKPAILKVAKQTLTTYAGETAYENEEFVLLNIYPKKNGTVKVTYGGLTKTVKDTSGAEEPNAVQVFFGTFNGVSDSVTTPASGELTIEGAYSGYGRGTYASGTTTKTQNTSCKCITGFVDLGEPKVITDSAFSGLTEITTVKLPDCLEQIGRYVFNECTNLSISSLPSGLTSIGDYAFYKCTNLMLGALPNGVTSIGGNAFEGCTNLALTSLPRSLTSTGTASFRNCYSITITEFPEGLQTIGNDAFFMQSYESTRMLGGTVTFPSTLQSIGSDAFRSNKVSGESYLGYFAKVIFYATTPPIISADTFGSGRWGTAIGEHMTFIVPKGCTEAYKAAEGWSEYAGKVEEAT